jgi:hypothetical protein
MTSFASERSFHGLMPRFGKGLDAVNEGSAATFGQLTGPPRPV